MNFKRLIKSNQWNCFEGILKCKYIQEWAVVIYFDPPLSKRMKWFPNDWKICRNRNDSKYFLSNVPNNISPQEISCYKSLRI